MKPKIMKKLLLSSLGIAICLSNVTGCRGVGQALGDRDAELRTGQWWAGPLPDIKPPKGSQRTVYLSYRNATQSEGYMLLDGLRTALQARGYRVVDNPEEAHFHLLTTLRFFGENAHADEGRTQSAALGAITGGATGALVASAAHAGTTGIIGGGLGGALIGGLAGTAIRNYGATIEYNLILDIRLGERQPKAVTKTVQRQQLDEQAAHTARHTGGGAIHGERIMTATTEQKMTEIDNLLWTESRLVLWAKQIRLQPHEAQPALEQALIKTLPQILL